VLCVDASSSRIVQVKAAQVTVSEKYRAGYTLRFPRVIKIRTDKSWAQCMDLSGTMTRLPTRLLLNA
jgi:DNA ligase-4